ncbi:hypothetical protein MD484_g3465, partial [Candolleomyces efflorescens]
MLPPPPPGTHTLQVVHVSSLTTALAKLNIEVPIEELMEVIRAEDEARRLKSIAEATRRRTALSTRKSSITPESGSLTRPMVRTVALQPTGATSGLEITTVSKFIPNPTRAATVDPLAKDRRRRLLELTEQSFPDGRVPDPFTLTWLGLSQETAANKLPFILASRIVVTSAADESDNPPQSVFENVWCLWDTGAQTSFVLTSQLDPIVRNNQTEGNALMDINFFNVNQTIGSVIHFRPQLPNGATFIILGQHALLNRLQYQIQPVSINPQLWQFPEAYGQIE